MEATLIRLTEDASATCPCVRVRKFIERGVKIYLLAGEEKVGPTEGFAQVSFTPSIWERGADGIEVVTGADDLGARAL